MHLLIPNLFVARCLLLLASFLLASCSINPKTDLASETAGTSPVLLDIPFFPQEEYQCGPAALATILVASGVDTSPEILTPQVFLPNRQGSLQLELLAATRRAYRIPYVIEDDLSMLLSELEQERPVLVLQNLRTQHFPIWHYAVLMGFDPDSNQVYLNTGTHQKQAMSAGKFMRLWNWADSWAMVALEPGEIPPGASAEQYFEATSDFETVAGAGFAEPAWQAAMQQWPDRTEPYLALGNHAYLAGKAEEAAEWYSEGLQLDKLNTALANNLATVLGEAGCPVQARSLLQPIADGLAEDSAWGEIVEATLSELGSSPLPVQFDCKQWITL